jgi:hypothetical protein
MRSQPPDLERAKTHHGARPARALALGAIFASLVLACSSGTDESASDAAPSGRFPCGVTTCDLATEYCQRPRGPGICPIGDAGGCIAGCPGCAALPPPSCAPIPKACAATPTCACIGPAACGPTPALCDTTTGGPRVDCLSS